MPGSDYASGGIYLYNVHYTAYLQNNSHFWRKSDHARIIICHHHHYQIRGAHVFWEFLYRLSHGAAEGGAVSHTPNQLEAALHTKRSTEATELIPEVCTYNENILVHSFLVCGITGPPIFGQDVLCMYIRV